MSLDVRTEPRARDRSMYADRFTELHDSRNWNQWVVLDTVKGGGLYDRLVNDAYVGLRDLRFQVETHRVDDGMKEVWIRVTGRRKKER